MFGKSSKKSASCTWCSVTSVIIIVLGAFALFASLVGVWMAHFGVENGPVFGTMSGSLSILSLIATLFLVKKMSNECACQMPSKK